MFYGFYHGKSLLVVKPPFQWNSFQFLRVILLMEEILHQLICVNISLYTGFYVSQVVQDFFHQQYLLNFGVIVVSFLGSSHTEAQDA